MQFVKGYLLDIVSKLLNFISYMLLKILFFENIICIKKTLQRGDVISEF